MNIVLFTSDEIFEPLPIRDERAKHILKILKKKEGDSFDAGIIDDMAGKAFINHIDKEGIHFHFTANNNGKPLYPISVIIGFPRPIQLKRAFRDMAGLGVSNIYLVGTDRGEKSYLDSTIIKDGAAYEALKAGCEQAKSTHIPNLLVYESTKICLHHLTNKNAHYQNSASIKIVLDPDHGKHSLHTLFAENADSVKTILEQHNEQENETAPHVFVSIGSERGWSDEELAFFHDAQFEPCTLGERILRTETAVTTAVSIILAELGII